MGILREVYQELKLQNVKCLHFANVLKNLTREDTNPLYKVFNLDQLSLNFQFVKWAATSSNRVLYNELSLLSIKIIINYYVKYII